MAELGLAGSAAGKCRAWGTEPRHDPSQGAAPVCGAGAAQAVT